MNNWPFISIGISTFRRKSLLERLIRSLEKYNTYPNYELVIVEDSPEDYKDSWEFLQNDEYLKKINARLVKQYACGDAKTKNRKIKEANKNVKFYYLMDDDVFAIRSSWIQYMIKMMETFSDVGILSAHSPVIIENDTIIQPQHRPIDIKVNGDLVCWYKARSSCSDWLVRKEVIEECGYFDESISHEEIRRTQNIDTRYILNMEKLKSKYRVASLPNDCMKHVDFGVSTY